MDILVRHYLCEDRSGPGQTGSNSDMNFSYVDFLCHMHKEIRALLGWNKTSDVCVHISSSIVFVCVWRASSPSDEIVMKIFNKSFKASKEDNSENKPVITPGRHSL